MRIEIKHPRRLSEIFKDVTGVHLENPLTGISTDSRECGAGDLYVAIVGNQQNGHNFLHDAISRGAVAALVSEKSNHNNFQEIIVKDPTYTIGEIAKKWRAQFDIPIVCITGSNGKTSTKELLVHVLSKKYNVHATEGNFNTSIGLPLTLLKLDNKHTVSVLEMGANKPGDIKNLCGMANPTHGLITNIAPAHLEGFGTMEAITKTKGELFAGLKKGISFVNMSDKRVASIPIFGERLTYGYTSNCDFTADIHQGKDGTLTLKMNKDEITTQSKNLSFIQNSVAVSSIAKTLGIGWKELMKDINSFKSPNGRCQVKQFSDVRVIDDTYNANLFSCLAALDYLKVLSGPGRKIFVFGDMFELGNSSKDQHSKVGHKCLEIDLDRLFTIGKETFHTHSIVNDKIYSSHFKLQSDLILELKKTVKPKDNILFKGSRGMRMEKIIEEVFLS
tara:strand:- start:28406 stop:29746 length:1341 start_codon:yes stop_codon:yes gene_type:complete